MKREMAHAERWWGYWLRIAPILKKHNIDRDKFIVRTFGDDRLFQLIAAKDVAQLAGVTDDLSDRMVGALEVMADLPPEIQRIGVATLPPDAGPEHGSAFMDTLAEVAEQLPEPAQQAILRHRDAKARQEASELDDLAAVKQALAKGPRYIERGRKEYVSIRRLIGEDAEFEAIIEAAYALVKRMEKFAAKMDAAA